MAMIDGEYANILNKYKILYMPSCLIIEMMTRLYSQVSMVNIVGNIHAVIPDLLILLRRVNHNLRCTSNAYRESRIKFFVGDWKDDRLRARKLFFNLMSRLGYLCEMVGASEKQLMFKAIEEMGREWGLLDGIMEEKCRERRFKSTCATCSYFRSESRDSWRVIMANILVSLDRDAKYDGPDSCLILLCYKRIKTQLLREIEKMESVKGIGGTFSPDRIMCISEEDLPISCPSCSLMTESRDKLAGPAKASAKARNHTTRRVSLKKNTDTRVEELRNRYLMPSSLSAIAYGRR